MWTTPYGLLIWATIFLAGCADADKVPQLRSPIEVTGHLQYELLDEASGMARSHKQKDILWVINDDGPPVLYAIDTTGAKRGKIELRDAENRDWEELAAFNLDGIPYLLVADIGDNEGQRKHVTLYVINEPDVDEGKAKVAWQVDFSYPEGPRDAEAVAVDTESRRILVLTKRDIPAELYELPLVPDSDKTIIASYLGAMDSLPQPTQRDVRNAPLNNDWHWQPSAIDIAADGKSALILTDHAMYYYARGKNETWLEALRRRPLGLKLGKYRNAESIAFDPAGESAFVTVEKMHAPLLRIDLKGAIEQ